MKTFSPIPTLLVLMLLPVLTGRAADSKALVDDATASLLSGTDPLNNLVVGVVRGPSSFVYRYGQTTDSPATPEEFEIASVTKPFTGLLLAKMVSEGKVRYDDPVRACADGETSGTCFNGTPITFLHLVTHYSGLPRSPVDQKGGRYTVADFQRFLAGYKLARAPGSQFEYSTTGYALLGHTLAERAGAMSFEELLKLQVLRPLALRHTHFAIMDGPASYAGPSGGLISTVEDLLRFVMLNIDPDQAGQLGAAIRLTQISDPTLKSIPPSIAARGWHVIQPMGYHWHSGVESKGRSFVAFDLKTKAGVVLLTKGKIAPTDSRLEMAGFSILGGLAVSQ